MDLLLEPILKNRLLLLSFVSILVLVDLLLEHKGMMKGVVHPTCFNPCFSGSASRTRYPSVVTSRLEVSILVLVDLLLEQHVFFWFLGV